ncbi:MAG TPA: hypothetical protein VM933_05900 [Acidimicrobiales bacterium]|nr:hypothetical protein [Acidimicrobiales bacterium]
MAATVLFRRFEVASVGCAVLTVIGLLLATAHPQGLSSSSDPLSSPPDERIVAVEATAPVAPAAPAPPASPDPEPAAATARPAVKATEAVRPPDPTPPISEPDAPTASPASRHKAPRNQEAGTIRTPVVGGWEGTPPAVPTAVDPETGDIAIAGHAVWAGDWVGVSTFQTDYVDLDEATGDYTFHAVHTFTGTWQGKAGSITWDEYAEGNIITGATMAENTIIRGDGDETFRCSSGRFIWVGVVLGVLTASYGGYHGEWVHGCPAER